VRAAILELAAMIENLVPFFECGCEQCLRRAAKGFRQLGEELEALLDLTGSPREHLGPAGRGPMPRDPDGPWCTAFSAEGIRQSANAVRELAAEV
jgi:hypothetical protein